MYMKAATRNRVINNLYLSTFLIAFGSVALASVLPCPAHTVSSDTAEQMQQEKRDREGNTNSDSRKSIQHS
ncbi:Coa2 protein [Maudiozyma humilis]|uniref:Coa2 protein n=1 Tax=Maudiozyma humilis TaxID=51915 RepID=A0AAV5S275_MAUHU|nr:Coa2 protein [Kazachstania humilis]